MSGLRSGNRDLCSDLSIQDFNTPLRHPFVEGTARYLGDLRGIIHQAKIFLPAHEIGPNVQPEPLLICAAGKPPISGINKVSAGAKHL